VPPLLSRGGDRARKKAPLVILAGDDGDGPLSELRASCVATGICIDRGAKNPVNTKIVRRTDLFVRQGRARCTTRVAFRQWRGGLPTTHRLHDIKLKPSHPDTSLLRTLRATSGSKDRARTSTPSGSPGRSKLERRDRVRQLTDSRTYERMHIVDCIARSLYARWFIVQMIPCRMVRWSQLLEHSPSLRKRVVAELGHGQGEETQYLISKSVKDSIPL
jgi:hypothetical protein